MHNLGNSSIAYAKISIAFAKFSAPNKSRSYRVHFKRRDDLYARLKEEKISDLEKHHIGICSSRASIASAGCQKQM